MTKLKPIHPREILIEEFLTPLKISQYRLAKDINVAAMRISEIVNGKRSISANTALRLSKYFGTSAEFWLNLQAHYDIEIESDKLKKELKKSVKVFQFEKLKTTLA